MDPTRQCNPLCQGVDGWVHGLLLDKTVENRKDVFYKTAVWCLLLQYSLWLFTSAVLSGP